KIQQFSLHLSTFPHLHTDLCTLQDLTTKRRERRRHTGTAEKFVIVETSRPRECYFHFTTATDTDNVRTVFRDVHQMILTHMLNTIGVY
ncbi:G protein alpha subunit 73B, partial [Danaus plexippus plexippus]